MATRINALRQRLSEFRDKLPSTQVVQEKAGRWLAQKTFSTNDRLELYEDLAFLLDNNQKLEVALTTMIATHGRKRPPVVFCLEDAYNALRQGHSVDRGLAMWIPKQEAAILSAAVQDGNLPAALYRAIAVVKGMDDMKSALISTLAYPVMLLSTTFAMMKMVSVYFLPKLTSLSAEENWSGALWWLSALSKFFVGNGIILGVLLCAMVGFVVWSMPNLIGNIRRHVLDKLLPWTVYSDVQGVSFLLNYSALMRASIKTEDALKMLNQYAPPWLYERLSATLRQVREGHHLGLALKLAGYGFPSSRAIDKLVLLTNGDNAEIIIENFAKAWLQQTVTRIKRTASILSYVALATNAGYMVLILMATQNLNDLVGTH